MPGSSVMMKTYLQQTLQIDQLEFADLLPLLLNSLSHTARPLAGRIFI